MPFKKKKKTMKFIRIILPCAWRILKNKWSKLKDKIHTQNTFWHTFGYGKQKFHKFNVTYFKMCYNKNSTSWYSLTTKSLNYLWILKKKKNIDGGRYICFSLVVVHIKSHYQHGSTLGAFYSKKVITMVKNAKNHGE
jgi:hypothetical protein